MLSDYKWWYVTRDDDGFITEAAVRFFEGENQEVTFTDFDGEKKTETRYVRTAKLNPKEIPELDGTCKTLADGTSARVYTAKDFGEIKSDDELRLFCNKQLALDKTRTPQEAQSEISDITKVK